MGDSWRPKFWRFWFPVILYSGIIFYASSIPDVKTPMPEIHFDRILHVLVYGPFGFLWARGISGSKVSMPRAVFWVSVIGASFLYGAGDEFHQSFVSGRNAGLDDVLADTVGGIVGGCLYLSLGRFWKNKEPGK